MKTLSILIPFLVILPACAEGPHLFVLSGQSNMARLDPAVSFTPAVEKRFGKANVIVVKDASGGKPIRCWLKDWRAKDGKEHQRKQPNGWLYARLIKKTQAAIGTRKPATVTLVWMQGESDACEGHGEVYEKSFQMLLGQLRRDLNCEKLGFVIGRLNDHRKKGDLEHWDLVREVQVKLADRDSLGEWIDTDDCNTGKDARGNKIEDDGHMSVEGYRIMGDRFADKAISLVEKQFYWLKERRKSASRE